MSDVSSFSLTRGIDNSVDQKVMTYLYGLSDFWVSVFEDQAIINTTLQGQSLSASDIYNNFLQLTSTLSLADISTTTNSQLHLQTISDLDLVPGSVATYYLTGNTVISSKYVANRPFLPTITLEQDVHFHIDTVANTVSFYKTLPQLGFPTRTTSTGVTEYSLWFVDARIDSQLIAKYYGDLLNITPETSTDQFRNLVYGYYYLYVNGPTLSDLKKGLNLVFGIPISREVETVLDIRFQQSSSQWLIITDQNTYFIPYGIPPTVAIGDILSAGQGLAEWVEIKDRVTNGEWWINLAIPETLLPFPPAGQSRYASAGSYADYVMREYLSQNSFLVRISMTSFQNVDLIRQIGSLIKEVKPSYTAPVYIWSIPSIVDKITLEEQIVIYRKFGISESIFPDARDFVRDSLRPYTRGQNPFTRFCGSQIADRVFGVANVLPRPFNGGIVDGYIGTSKEFMRDGTYLEENKELGWLMAITCRENTNYIPRRSTIIKMGRSTPVNNTIGVGKIGFSVPPTGYRRVFLYTISTADLVAKLLPLGKTLNTGGWIDTYNPGLSTLTTNFTTLFSRGSGALPSFFPKSSYLSATVQSTDLVTGDSLQYIKVHDMYYGVFWITSNFTYVGIPYLSNMASEEFVMQTTGTPTRGQGILKGNYYLMRGGKTSVDPSPLVVKYEDTVNTLQTSRRSNLTPMTVISRSRI